MRILSPYLIFLYLLPNLFQVNGASKSIIKVLTSELYSKLFPFLEKGKTFSTGVSPTELLSKLFMHQTSQNERFAKSYKQKRAVETNSHKDLKEKFEEKSILRKEFDFASQKDSTLAER